MRENEKCAVLIGAGELHKQQADCIKQNRTQKDCIIALDGGLVFCAEHDIVPDRIVGDFDSLPAEKQELLEKYPQERIYRLPCEKDDTDTLAAIRMAAEIGYERFIIYGGLGGRLSHTIANIQSLLFLKEQGLYGELVGDKIRVFLLKNESTTLRIEKANMGGYISIFSYSGKSEGVTIKNLKYEVENMTLTNSFPIGVSNEFMGKEMKISVKKGVLLVVVEE